MSAFGSTAFGAAAFASGGGVVYFEGNLADSVTLTPAFPNLGIELGLLGDITLTPAFPNLGIELGLLAGVTLVSTLLNPEVDSVLLEYLALTSTVDPQAHRDETIAELLNLAGATQLVMSADISDVLSLVDAADTALISYSEIIDTMVLTGLAENTYTAMEHLIEVLALRDALVSLQDGDVTDAATFVSAVDANLRALAELVSASVFADELVPMANFTVLVGDGFVLNETLTPQYSLIAAITEGLEFSVGFVFDDVPYLGLSMNAAT